MFDKPSSAVNISHKIIMEFYAAVFRLYPNITRIQEVINEDTESLSCTCTVVDRLSDSEQESMEGALLDLMQKMILPTLPKGYQSTLQDIILKMPEKTDDAILKDLCDTLQKEFPDICETEYSIIGDEVAFSIAGRISPQSKQIIRHFLIAGFPLWSQYQPRDPVFFNNKTLTPTAESTKKSFGAWLRSILQGG